MKILHEHFEHPAVVEGGAYRVPLAAGFSAQTKAQSLSRYSFPDGEVWQ